MGGSPNVGDLMTPANHVQENNENGTLPQCQLATENKAFNKKQDAKDTLPETNIAPQNKPTGKGDSYWKPPFLGAMLVLGGYCG